MSGRSHALKKFGAMPCVYETRRVDAMSLLNLLGRRHAFTKPVGATPCVDRVKTGARLLLGFDRAHVFLNKVRRDIAILEMDVCQDLLVEWYGRLNAGYGIFIQGALHAVDGFLAVLPPNYEFA